MLKTHDAARTENRSAAEIAWTVALELERTIGFDRHAEWPKIIEAALQEATGAERRRCLQIVETPVTWSALATDMEKTVVGGNLNRVAAAIRFLA